MTPEENKKTSTSHSTTTTDESRKEKSTRYFTYGPNGEKIYTPNYSNETSTTTTVAPDEQMVQYFNERVRPIVEKQHGLEFDDKGNLKTPLSPWFGFDPEKERQRREQEQKLNEWKRKEANWYNGISVLMDIATAAGGGKVGRRTPSDAAAKAVADNERLRKEQQAEDYMVEKAKQDKVAAFYKDLSDRMTALNGKVTTKQTEKPLSETIEYTPKKTVTTDTETTTTGSLRSDKTTGGKTYSIGIINTKDGVNRWDKAQVSKEDYDHIGNLLANYYQRILQSDASSMITEPQYESTDLDDRDERRAAKSRNKELKKGYEEQQEEFDNFKVKLQNELKSYQYVDINGVYHWDIDRMLSDGLFYNLPDYIKQAIKEETKGRVTFGAPVELSNGLKRETAIINNDMGAIQPKGSARPYVLTVSAEEEELMGN